MQTPPDSDAPAPAGLFDPARHEPLTATPWDEDAERAAIDQIVADATGDPRWAALLEAGLRILLEEMVFDERIAAWIWQQDLYGRTSCHLGAAHGFAGNVYAALRAAKWVPPELVAEFADRALQTLQALALRADGCANWHPMHPPVGDRLPLLQDCHGAPSIVCRLAGAPHTPAWDELLVEAGTLTWRAGPLLKGSGLCHGTAGNGYALLKLWTRTGDPAWLSRARAFAMHAAAQVAAQRAASGQARHSLWTGDIGVALYLQDCISGDSGFPTLDVFWYFQAWHPRQLPQTAPGRAELGGARSSSL